jgi:hypothetical protein
MTNPVTASANVLRAGRPKARRIVAEDDGIRVLSPLRAHLQTIWTDDAEEWCTELTRSLKDDVVHPGDLEGQDPESLGRAATRP